MYRLYIIKDCLRYCFVLFEILFFILHLINSSNECVLFVPRDRPIFSRIGSKKVRIFKTVLSSGYILILLSTVYILASLIEMCQG